MQNHALQLYEKSEKTLFVAVSYESMTINEFKRLFR